MIAATTRDANASLTPITKEVGTEMQRLNTRAAWTCRLAPRSGAKKQGAFCLRVAEGTFSLLGYHVSSTS